MLPSRLPNTRACTPGTSGERPRTNGFVVTVDQVRDGLDHAVLDVVIHSGHQAKVQDGQPAVGRADQVAGMRVCRGVEISLG